jgi:hypothetical protein
MYSVGVVEYWFLTLLSERTLDGVCRGVARCIHTYTFSLEQWTLGLQW